MSIDPTIAYAELSRLIDADLTSEIEVAALRTLTAHALSVAPDATHMLMESSDQGSYMCVPSFLDIGTEHTAEAEWDEHIEEHEDPLNDAVGWLTWEHDAWERFADPEHPYTNKRGGYYAIDLRRVVAETASSLPQFTLSDFVEAWDAHEGEVDHFLSEWSDRLGLRKAPKSDPRVVEVLKHIHGELYMFQSAGAGQPGEDGSAADAAADVAERLYRVYGVKATEERPFEGWTHPEHLPGITVATWDSDAGDGLHDGALVVQVDTDGDTNNRRVRINLNDAPVWDGIAATDERPGQFFEAVPPARTCTACGAPVEYDGERLVDTRIGATFDQCPERYEEATDTPRGHV